MTLMNLKKMSARKENEMSLIKKRNIWDKWDSYNAQHDEYRTDCYCSECGEYLGSTDYTYRPMAKRINEFDPNTKFCKYCGSQLYSLGGRKMIIDKDCGYFNEEINDPYSPYPGECEDCYRYDTCLNAKDTDVDNVEKLEVIGWRPISEYSRKKYDWVLIKYFDGDFECIPDVAEMRSDGRWWTRADIIIPDIFDVRYFFVMNQLDG